LGDSRADVKEEDQDLTEEQFPLLNEQFYTSHPAAYFRKRLQLLILAAGAAAEIAQLLAQGVRYEKLIAQLDPTDVNIQPVGGGLIRGYGCVGCRS
jgi:hypothetical protein